jgi:hypothetical protein
LLLATTVVIGVAAAGCITPARAVRIFFADGRARTAASRGVAGAAVADGAAFDSGSADSVAGAGPRAASGVCVTEDFGGAAVVSAVACSTACVTCRTGAVALVSLTAAFTD